jgi:hypothetical protein
VSQFLIFRHEARIEHRIYPLELMHLSLVLVVDTFEPLVPWVLITKIQLYSAINHFTRNEQQPSIPSQHLILIMGMMKEPIESVMLVVI